MLLAQRVRAAASRIFCTAGSSRPIRRAMIAMTTSNSTSVNPRRGDMAIPSRSRLPCCSLRILNGFGLILLLAGCQNKSPIEGKSPAELEKMLNSSDPAVQAQGALGLSRRGEQAAPAVPSLIEALKRPDPLVRQNSALALGAIGPAAAPA